MANTDTFYVSTKDNRVRRTTEPSREYFVRGGTKEGKAKYIIEVFGYNHEETAKKVRDMVDQAGMQDKIFTIKVSTR
jgi:hypothetical protein